jgi:hypothetical protein
MKMEYLTINVYSYINPQRLLPVNVNTAWYREGKVLQSDYHEVIALVDGYKVKYQVLVYKFRKIPDRPGDIDKLISYIKANTKKQYRGWVHHAQVYRKIPGEKTGQHKQYLPLNFTL